MACKVKWVQEPRHFINTGHVSSRLPRVLRTLKRLNFINITETGVITVIYVRLTLRYQVFSQIGMEIRQISSNAIHHREPCGSVSREFVTFIQICLLKFEINTHWECISILKCDIVYILLWVQPDTQSKQSKVPFYDSLLMLICYTISINVNLYQLVSSIYAHSP